jgi:hypothetical protein
MAVQVTHKKGLNRLISVLLKGINENRFKSQLMNLFTKAKRSAIFDLRKKNSKWNYVEKWTLFTFGLLM